MWTSNIPIFPIPKSLCFIIWIKNRDFVFPNYLLNIATSLGWKCNYYLLQTLFSQTKSYIERHENALYSMSETHINTCRLETDTPGEHSPCDLKNAWYDVIFCHTLFKPDIQMMWLVARGKNSWHKSLANEITGLCKKREQLKGVKDCIRLSFRAISLLLP